MKAAPLLVFAFGLSVAVTGVWAYSVEQAAAEQLAQARTVIDARDARNDEIVREHSAQPGSTTVRADFEADLSEAIARVVRSTVEVESIYQPDAQRALFAFPGQRETWFRRMVLKPMPPAPGELEGASAGVIVAPGVVLTTAHSLPKDRSVTFRVNTVDGRRFDVQSVAYSRHYDAAILRIADRDTPAIPFAGERPEAGEPLATIGHPNGQKWAVAMGSLSAVSNILARDGSGQVDRIEADFITAPGNSGGPVIDAAGHLVGIHKGRFQGRAVAVPAADAFASIGAGAAFSCYRNNI